MATWQNTGTWAVSEKKARLHMFMMIIPINEQPGIVNFRARMFESFGQQRLVVIASYEPHDG